jgi:hypothetical protein
MRSGWERDAIFLGFEAGPFGYGHQHEDKLGVVIFAYGKDLLVEGGSYAYDASKWRRYVLSSAAHNVILVDGQGQVCLGCSRSRLDSETWPFKRQTFISAGDKSEGRRRHSL